jgi:Mg-chelatase subunit ChlD
MGLVCVTDNSESMSRKKAKLVRKSLKYLLKVFGTDDRISLVSFDGKARILTPLLRNNDINKSRLKEAIA